MTTRTAPTRNPAQADRSRTAVGDVSPAARGGASERPALGDEWITAREAAIRLGMDGDSHTIYDTLTRYAVPRVETGARGRRVAMYRYEAAAVQAIADGRRATVPRRLQHERWRDVACPRCGRMCFLEALAKAGAYRLVDPFDGHSHMGVCTGEMEAAS